MFFERMFLQYALLNPEESTEYRILETLGVHINNHRLNEVSAEQFKKNMDFKIEHYDMLQSYKRNDQTASELFSTDLLRHYFEGAIYHLQFPFDEYAIDHIKGPHAQIPFFLANCHLIEKFSDAEDYLARISSIPYKLEQAKQYAELLKEYNALPPVPIVENMIGQVDIFLNDGLEYNLLYLDMLAKMDVLVNFPDEPIRDIKYSLRREIEDGVLPAYQSYKEFLIALKEEAPQEIGVWRFSEGETFYRYLLAQYLTLDNQLLYTDFSPDSLYKMAQGFMLEAKQELDYALIPHSIPSHLSVAEKLAYLYQDRMHFYSNDKNGRQSFLGDLALMTYQTRKETERMIGLVPTQDVAFRRMPDYYEPYLTEAYYYPGSLDLVRKPVLYLNLSDMASFPKYSLTSWALDYCYPGLHYQKQMQQESDFPSFRKVISFRAYEDGWGMYAVSKILEGNVYTNPSTMIGIKHAKLISSVKMATDLGIHYLQWDYDSAIAFFSLNAGVSAARAKKQIDEIIVSPGKSVAGYYGSQLFSKGEKMASSISQDVTTREYLQKMIGMGPAPTSMWYSYLRNLNPNKEAAH